MSASKGFEKGSEEKPEKGLYEQLSPENQFLVDRYIQVVCIGGNGGKEYLHDEADKAKRRDGFSTPEQLATLSETIAGELICQSRCGNVIDLSCSVVIPQGGFRTAKDGFFIDEDCLFAGNDNPGLFEGILDCLGVPPLDDTPDSQPLDGDDIGADLSSLGVLFPDPNPMPSTTVIHSSVDPAVHRLEVGDGWSIDRFGNVYNER